jgi:alpha-mannosidase
MFDLRLEKMKALGSSYWSTRILSQLEYANELSKLANNQCDELVNQTIAFLAGRSQRDSAITQETAVQAEEILKVLSPQAKQHKLLCAGHAHIDMNWMWRWDETVTVTLETFRTMLALMRDYPAFKFSQSQASVYQIVETYAPELLPEIKQRIQDGRWEVTASTWVEADKNLPNGESHARHLLLTRRYLSQLLDLKSKDFSLDFEPDTFGHSANVPEILTSAGVKYYYHCRGDKNPSLYRWLAPSGKSIVTYLEPFWYLGYVDPSLALFVPSFCRQFGMDTALRVYGVGDHGGGPTRRDIQRILDMDTWPVFPSMRFGTFSEYFAQVEKIAATLPEVKGELNFVFTGCYSSQSRIKKANRLAEAALDVSERFSAFAAASGAAYSHPAFTKAWRNTLFNQFHDIIPGSGVIDTREYTLGLFQESMALAASQKARAFQAILPAAEPDNLEKGFFADTSDGAGVGYGVEQYRVSQVSRGGGLQRLFHVFNPSPWPRRQVVEITVWDWDGDLKRLAFQNATGQPARHHLLDQGFNNYWFHRYLRVLVEVTAPACGYTSLTLNETSARLDSLVYPGDPRTEEPQIFLLENEHIQARFDPRSFALVSLIDKASREELVAPARPALFRLVQEDDQAGMTAWIVGRYRQVHDLVENVRLLKYDSGGPLRQSLAYEITWGAGAESHLSVNVTLDAGSSSLEYAVDCDWHEVGKQGQGVPQLNFYLPVNFACQAYHYDIPFGTIRRQPIDQDVPANSWASALREDNAGKKTIQLITEGSYAFRGVDDALALTLLRSSYDPDPYPELGVHRLRFAVSLAPAGASLLNKKLISNAYDYTHPLDVISGAGKRLVSDSFVSLESGAAAVSAIKAPEDGEAGELVLRLYETEGQTTLVKLKFKRDILQATLVDLHEQPLKNAQPVKISGGEITFEIFAHCISTLRVKLAV